MKISLPTNWNLETGCLPICHRALMCGVCQSVPNLVAGSAPVLPLLPSQQRKLEKKKQRDQKKKQKQEIAKSKDKGKKRKIPLRDPEAKRQKNFWCVSFEIFENLSWFIHLFLRWRDSNYCFVLKKFHLWVCFFHLRYTILLSRHCRGNFFPRQRDKKNVNLLGHLVGVTSP